MDDDEKDFLKKYFESDINNSNVKSIDNENSRSRQYTTTELKDAMVRRATTRTQTVKERIKRQPYSEAIK